MSTRTDKDNQNQTPQIKHWLNTWPPRAQAALRVALLTLAALLLLWAMSAAASSGRLAPERSTAYRTVRVIALLDRTEHTYGQNGEYRDITLTFTAEGAGGEQITAVQSISDSVMLGDHREIEPGSRVIVMNNAAEGMTPSYVFTCFVRTDALLALGAVFVLFLLVFGRGKGLVTLIALVLTCASVFGCFIPAVLAGKNIYLWTFLVCAYIVVSTLLLIGQGSRKGTAAILGCLGGTAISACVMAVADIFLHLSGNLDETTAYLTYLNTPSPIDLRALLYAAILIGALGAVMDVSVDISSALHELAEKLEHPSFSLLLRSGVTIGRDLIGTMSNTLILAYIGSSLSVVLLIAGSSGNSLFYVFNQERIIFEILQALVGSFGILIAIPLTAAASALLFCRRKPEQVRDEYAEQLEKLD